MPSFARERWEIWNSRPVCFVCHELIENFRDTSIEHIIPRSKGGTNQDINLSVSHKLCNSLKSDIISRDEWNKRIAIYLLDENTKKSIQIEAMLKKPYIFDERTWLMYVGPGLVEKTLIDSFPETLMMEKFFETVTLPTFEEIPNPRNQRFKLHHAIIHLKSNSKTSEIFKLSECLENNDTQNYWYLVFGIMFLHQYLNREENIYLIHAIEILKELERKKVDYEPTRKILDYCYSTSFHKEEDALVIEN